MADSHADVFLENLKAFNRKERYHLLQRAIGMERFQLDQCFLCHLLSAIGNLDDESAAQGAYFAMDYHLDWLAVAVYLQNQANGAPLYAGDLKTAPDAQLPDNRLSKVPSNCPDKVGQVLTGTQEDIDLLVAYKKDDVVQLILVEAKADTGWSVKQLGSKALRLGQIFGTENRNAVQSVNVHFVLASPSRPRNLQYEEKPDSCPEWLFYDSDYEGEQKSLRHIPLYPMGDETLYQPTRTNKDEEGVYRNWTIKSSAFKKRNAAEKPNGVRRRSGDQ